MVLAIVLMAGKYNYAMSESIPIEIWTDNNLEWDFWVEKQGGQEVFSKSSTGMSSFSFVIDNPGDYLLQAVTRGEPNYDSIIIHVTGTGTEPLVSTYELRIKYANLGWGTSAQLESSITSIANAINPLIVPLGYTFKNQYTHDATNKTISLFYEGSSPAIPLAAIAIAVFGILFAIGFVIMSISWLKESAALETITKTKADITEDATDLYTQGKITKEQYETILSGLTKLDLKGKPTDWGTIALIAVGILAAAYLASGFIGGKR